MLFRRNQLNLKQSHAWNVLFEENVQMLGLRHFMLGPMKYMNRFIIQ